MDLSLVPVDSLPVGRPHPNGIRVLHTQRLRRIALKWIHPLSIGSYPAEALPCRGDRFPLLR